MLSALHKHASPSISKVTITTKNIHLQLWDTTPCRQATMHDMMTAYIDSFTYIVILKTQTWPFKASNTAEATH